MTEEARAIREAENQRYKIVIDELNAAVFEWNHETGEFYESPSYKNFAISEIGNEDIFSNRGPLDVIHPDDVPLLQRFFQDSKSGMPRAETTLRMKMRDGDYHWCKMCGYFFRDENGNPSRTIGVIIDINSDRDQELIINSLINGIPGGIAVFKVTDRFECELFSDGFAKMSGRTREEITELNKQGKLFEAVVASFDQEMVMEKLNDFVRKNQQVNMMYRCIAKNGEVKWINLSAVKMREENGCPVYYCVFTTPSDETKLYRDIVENSATGVLIAERATRRIIYMNEALCKAYGISDRVVSGEAKITEVADNKNLPLQQSDIDSLNTDEFSVFHVSCDDDIYLSIRGRALDWNGTDAYILYVTDESAEHRRLINLQELIDNIPGGVGIFEIHDGVAHQVYINDSYYKLISDDREHRKYKRDTEFLTSLHPDDRATIHRAVKMVSQGADEVALDFRTKDSMDEYIWIHLTGRVVSRIDKSITMYCCFMDIRDAMAAKEALEKSNTVMKYQYKQERERRRILEKGSFLNSCVSLTREKVISLSCEDERFKDYTSEFDCQTALEIMLETIPYEEDRQAVCNMMNCKNAIRLFEDGVAEKSIEYRSYQADGRLHWIRAVCNVTDDISSNDIISYLYFYDVDEEKKKRLASSYVMNEEIDYVLLCSLSTKTAKFINANNETFEPELSSSFGLPEFRTSKFYNDIVSQDREKVIAFFDANKIKRKLEKEEAITITFRKKSADGIRRKKAKAFFLDETHDDIVITRRDITDLYEEEQHQKQVLQAAAEEAIRANRAKSEFLARVSHDMRTPMNGILGIAALMKDKTDINEIRDELAQLELSGQYLLRLINDTLDMNKIESGKLELHPQLIDSEKLLKNILANASIMAKEKGVELVVKTPGIHSREWVQVLADSARIEQIVMNVISNAIKFTQAGGKVSLTMETVSITDTTVVDRYIIRDTGIGMSEEFIPHMFEPFAQEGRANTDRESGTGLGMAIVKQLIDMMGGEISVKSKLNFGTEITLLMRYDVAGENDKKENAKTLKYDYTQLKKKRVLLCEDHPINSRIAKQLLEKKEMLVETAENGKIGVEMFSSSNEGYYDAVLMDIRMPEMDGLSAAKAIRLLNRKDAKEIPIIAVTANAYDEDVKKSIEAGMTGHLAKPIEPKKLYDALYQQTVEQKNK